MAISFQELYSPNEVETAFLASIQESNSWTWDRKRRVLAYPAYSSGVYEVDLERMPDARAVLDWISQVQKKTWATPVVVGDLVRMLDALLDFQGCICRMDAGHGPSGDAEAHLSKLERRK